MIWRFWEEWGAIYEKYILNSADGTMCEQESLETENSKFKGIMLSTLKEFEANELTHPNKQDLLHSLNFEKYCKIEFSHNTFQGIIRVLPMEDKKKSAFVFGFLMYQNMLWLVSDRAELFSRIEQMQEDVYPGFTLHDFLLTFFNHLIENDMIFLEKIKDSLEHMEEKVLCDKAQEHFNECILQYGRKLSKRHGYYVQMINIGDYMQTFLRETLPEAESGWNLFTHRVERLHGYVEQTWEHLLQIREMYQTQIEAQQNRVVTILTVVTTIFLPLSLVTGWYGMNFSNMPELHWKYGYLIVILLSIVVEITEICYFKKKKML